MLCVMPAPHSRHFLAAPIVITALFSGIQNQPGVPLENASPSVKALVMLPLSGVRRPVAVPTARDMSE